jgi:hypothetical protein
LSAPVVFYVFLSVSFSVSVWSSPRMVIPNTHTRPLVGDARDGGDWPDPDLLK